MYPSSVALAIEDSSLRGETVAAFASIPSDVQHVDAEDVAALLEYLAARQPDVLVMDVAAFPDELETVFRDIRLRAPHTKIVAIHPTADPVWILQSLRGGAAEFAHTPLSETLMPALKRIGTTLRNDSSRKPHGKILGFLSAKGGCGATTLACHIAVQLHSQTQQNTLLADFDLSSGLAGFLMKASGEYSVLDATRNLARLDQSLWKAFLTQIRPGLNVLPAPVSISHREYPDEADFQKVLRFMRTQHAWSVIDLGRSLTSNARAALNEVDELFLVSTTEVIALHGLKAIVRGLQDDHQNSHKLHLVLNRAPKMMDITRGEMEKILGRPLYATFPNDYPSLYQSYAQGNLLPPGSKLAQHFAQFASRIIGVEEPKPKKRFSLLS